MLLEGLAVELEASQTNAVEFDVLDLPEGEQPRAEVARRFTLTTEEVVD